jgi:glycosyltransferase involved in cell wall biosynthesis
MRFHVLAIPHTATNKEYLVCAYTQKVLDWCRMMSPKGHTIFHYGHELSDVPCTEHVTLIRDEFLRTCYGSHDPRTELYKQNKQVDREFVQRALVEVGKRIQKGDFLLCFWGWGHKPVADAFDKSVVVEPGIGTFSSFAPFRVFESYAMMNYHYGKENRSCPSWYDAVIPCAVDPADFEYREKKGDYFLYLGRVMTNKGINIAIQVSEALGKKLVVAGPGSLQDLGYQEIPNNVEFVGPVLLEKRKELLAGARALFSPTYYNEPFGKVVIEAFLSGTPVISSDWGGFAETNLHGLTGYRCRTFEQFEWAARNIDRLDPVDCRKWAERNYSLDRVSGMHEEYYSSLLKVTTGNGFYEPNKDRGSLDWLVTSRPKPKKRIAVLMFSTGRTSLLEKMLDSFRDNVDFGDFETYRILIDDMPVKKDGKRDDLALEHLATRWGIDRMILNEDNIGLDRSVKKAWSFVPADCDYIWHQEEDFTFDQPVDIQQLVDALETCPKILNQVALLRHPVYEWEKVPGGIYGAYPEGTFSEISWTSSRERHTVTVHERHFTFNPCLYRRKIVEYPYKYEPQEGVIAWEVLKRHPGSFFAFYGGIGTRPRITHIGDESVGRKVTDPRYDPETNTYREIP